MHSVTVPTMWTCWSLPVWAVAMGDGTDVAKEHANYVTKGLHEDGIYHALKHFGLI